MEESIAIAIEQEEHQNRLTEPRHRNRIQRDLELKKLKDDFEDDVINFDEYCSRLRKVAYEYMSRFDKEN